MLKNKLYLAIGALAGVCFSTSAATPPDFDIGGAIQVDAAFFDGAHNDHARGSDYYVRRARLGLKHESKKGWEGEFEIDIDAQEDTVGITDAYVRYTGWSFGEVTFGKMKEPFGLENLTGSKSINTIERSVVTESFKAGRNYGLMFSTFGDLYTVEFGGFQTSKDEYGLDGYALTGRGVFHPINTETHLVHLGVSLSNRDMQGSEHRINEALEVEPAASVIESRRIRTDSIDQYSLEAAYKFKAFSIQTEWMEQTLKQYASGGAEPGPDITYSGYYVLASYFLTGESRSYKKGSFGGTKPNSERGAWELVARYSDIDLGDTASDVRANNLLIGVNYYATGRMRLMLNYAKADIESPKEDENGSGESIIFRAQYAF
jgi:phosphate-selective porin OprO/OprP